MDIKKPANPHPSEILQRLIKVTYLLADGTRPSEVIRFHQIDWDSLDEEANVIFIDPKGPGERLPAEYSTMEVA